MIKTKVKFEKVCMFMNLLDQLSIHFAVTMYLIFITRILYVHTFVRIFKAMNLPSIIDS